MRLLMYFSIGFCGVCGLWVYTDSNGIRLACLAAMALLCTGLGKDIRKAAVMILGCIAGIFWFALFRAFYLETAMALDDVTQTVTIRAADYSYETSYGIAVDGIVTQNGKPYQVRTYLDRAEPIAPGTRITGSFRFRVTTAGSESESTYHQSKGIFLLAYQKGEATVTASAPHWLDYPAILRQQIKTILQTHFPEDTFPFAKALLIGDTSDLDYETDTDFKVSGIRHVVAVSGLHVSILFTLLSTVTLHKRWLTALVGFPTLLLFAAVAGFTPSVTRSCIMFALMLLAMLVNKEYDGPTALSFAALVILVVNPLAAASVSLQLSVASVAGIYLFDPRIRKWQVSLFGDTKGRNLKAFFVRWFTTSVSVTLSAMPLTTPLCAVYFGTVSLIGVVTNLLALWVISFVFYGIMGVCLLHGVWSGAAAVLARVISVPVRYVLLTAKILAKAPIAAVYTESVYIIAWLVFVYALLAVFCISRRRKPVLLASCAVLGLCISLAASWTEPMTDEVRFTVLDVGQGQCLLLQSEGKTMMIDCGGDSDAASADKAARFLLSQGISRLDALVLTHLDRDHEGGARNLLTRLDTELLILPAVHSDISNLTKGRVIYAAEDLSVTFGSTAVHIFAPTFPGNSNEMSLCLLLDTKKCDILVTGDRSGFGERALLRNSEIPDVDILMAGHHGSENSTCEELLAAVRPEIVCISVSADNSYGHPAPELLKRLAEYNCAVYRTDQHGTITIRR